VPLVHICIHVMSSTTLLHRAYYMLIASSQLHAGGRVSHSGAIAAPPFNRLLVELIIEMQAFEDELDG
jgi:hypothetical protein